ncbi:MAG: hypothetical protein QGM48_10920 [Actinomycetota bacterium]|nr:hypothetical protein [Actinomycetota bacterium]
MNNSNRTASMGIGIFVIVLVTLQIFLLTIGLETLLAYEPGQAWAAAALSTVLGAGSIGLCVFFRRS